ncbi:MAG: folate-binding protein [Terriglobales bacterium]
MAEHSQAQVVADYGDARAEFAALISGSAVYDLGARSKIKLTGSDRVRWLNGMVTNNIRDLAANHGVYAFLLNPQGRILGDLYAYNQGGALLIDSDQSQLEKLLAIFDKYIIMDDVEVANISGQMTAIGMAGPRTREVLQAAGIELPELEPLQFVDLTWQNAKLTLLRSDNPVVESYELWLAPENVSPVWNAIVKAGASPTGAAAVEWLRVAAGVPRYGQDIRERDLPQETSQDRALHFTKGCYVGQEIVERIRSRGAVHRQFTGFEIHSLDNSGLPAPGSKIQVEGKDVGEITSVASLPSENGEHAVALGYIRREVGNPGRQVHAGDTVLAVARLPFIQL